MGIEGLREVCPSCGETPKGYELFGKDGGHICIIKCIDCSIETDGYDNFEDAIEDWRAVCEGENK